VHQRLVLRPSSGLRPDGWRCICHPVVVHVTEADDLDRSSDAEVDILDLEFVAADGAVAGLVRLELRPLAGVSRFMAAVLRPRADPIVVIDYDLPLSRGALEFRAPGVWAELCCETPLDHWTIGLEAFGLGVAAHEVVTPSTYGTRVAVGLDLDLDTVSAPDGDGSAFSVGVRVHGEVLVDEASYEIDGVGVRRRRTDGHRPTSTLLAAPPPLHGEVRVGWPAEDGLPSTERRGWFMGSRPGWTSLDYSGA
jgi:hypothetical protein